MARPAKKSRGTSPLQRWWVHALFLVGAYAVAGALILAVLLGLPGLPGFLRPKPRIVEKVVEREVRVMVTPTPAPKFIPRKEATLATLYNGVQFRTEFESLQGGLAAAEREDGGSYTVDVNVRVRVPEPNVSLGDLSKLNSRLPDLLPGLAAMVDDARVSPFYHELYDRKVRDLEASLGRLDRLPTRHNFYDCETILELRHPSTGRRALLVQAEMDVVADGSDPDRTVKVVGSYSNYQPITSYGWARRSRMPPNPFIGMYEERIAKWRSELKTGPAAARAKELRGAIEDAEHNVRDLKARSFLVARADPFVVMPTFMVVGGDPERAPRIGDYAVAIHDGTLYPAIVGDAGPNTKIGEASLRIAQTINPKATAYHRPVSDLTITYIVFPGTAQRPFSPPDYEDWRERCAHYLAEIGGHNGNLYAWSDVLAEEKAAEDKATAALASGEADTKNSSTPATPGSSPLIDPGAPSGADD